MRLLDRLFKRTPKRKKDEGTAFERYRKSFFHAIDGIIYCVKYEHNMIIILIATVISIILGFLLNISSLEWLFVISMCGAVSACEMINSSIEATIDLYTTSINPLAKLAKDTASSSTLIMSITAFIGGCIIFIPKIITLIGG